MPTLSPKPNASWPSSAAEAALALALNRHQERKVREGLLFSSFLRAVSPPPIWHWDWPYQRAILDELALIESGQNDRLMLFLPPRHGKSEMVTVRFPIYWLARYKRSRVVVAAYNAMLAEKFSRKSRRVLTDAGAYGITLSQERSSVQDWETSQGGSYRAIGVGGGITGQGGDLIIIDDPVKSREEANSLTYRDKVWDWFTDDLWTRREPGAKVIIIQTRWHEDDLSGRILASDDAPNWRILSLPALAENDDPLGRAYGDALCPERYDVKALLDIRKVLGTRSFSALYQQHPTEQEGDMFRRSWFQFVDEVPVNAKRLRYWDRGATQDGGDYTVGTLMAIGDAGEVFVEDVVRGQWSTFERDRRIEETALADRRRYGRVPIVLEQEPGSSGVDVIRILTRQLAGYAVTGDRPTGSKETRAEPFAAQCEGGNVYLKRASWNSEWLDELTSFPFGAHDDQVDTASGAFNKLVVRGKARKPKSYQWAGGV